MAINIAYISTQFEQWEGCKLKAYIPCFVKPEAQARVGKASSRIFSIILAIPPNTLAPGDF